MLERTLGQSALIVLQRRIEIVDAIADPEAEIRRHLIVARTRGVQSSGGRADQFRQAAFDVEMNIFQRTLEGEGARLDF